MISLVIQHTELKWANMEFYKRISISDATKNDKHRLVQQCI